MREIKYRAWDGKQWYVPILADGKVFRTSRDFEDYNDAPHDNVVEFTGLKDKNGRDIYEGDVLEYEVGDKWLIEPIGTEHHDGGLYGLCASFQGNGVAYWIDASILAGKVIGNIYENPDLLGGDVK